MNTSIIRYILGLVLKMEAALMVLPCIVALVYGEYKGLFSYLFVLCICAIVGFISTHKKTRKPCFLSERGLCSYFFKLDSFKYHGLFAFCYNPRNSVIYRRLYLKLYQVLLLLVQVFFLM